MSHVIPVRARRFAAVAAAALLLGVAGCSGADTELTAAQPEQLSVAVPPPDSAVDGAPTEIPAAETSAERTAAEDEAGHGVPYAPVDVVSPPVEGRDVIRTAAMDIRITLDESITRDTPADERARAQRAATSGAAARARAAATGAGGYVASSEQAGDTVTLTVRVPAAGYESFLGALDNLGEVVSGTEASEDVTEQVADINSRITTMRASVERVRALLTEATDIGDVVDIESELSRREADLESLLAQQATLKNRTTYSTVALTFSAVLAPAEQQPIAITDERDERGFMAGLRSGWDTMVDFGTAVAAVIGALVPFLPVVLVVAVLLMLWRRHWVRTRPAAAPIPAPADRVDVVGAPNQ